jgi:hypothetical protein
MDSLRRFRIGSWLGIAAAICASAALAQSLNWRQLPGTGNDVGVGANGTAWMIGTNPVPGGFGIYRWNGSAWDAMPGGAVRIDVDPQGNPWVVNNTGNIYQWAFNGWKQQPGQATDIGIGAKGDVWVIGAVAEAGGYGIFHWTPTTGSFTKIPGGAVRIDVDPAGNPWVVNSNHEIFRLDHGPGAFAALSKFTRIPGPPALDVGIGGDGSVFIVGTDHGVYRWSGLLWTKSDGALDSVSVDPKGNPWGVNSAKAVYAAGGSGSAPAPAKPGDVTAQVEDLGIPTQQYYPTRERIYARNPWDMKLFQGLIYIGSGNSNNEGPAPNAGPVHVIALDPKTGKFTPPEKQPVLPDEQIDEFRVINGALVVPGHDPKKPWDYGEFYVLHSTGYWSEVRTIKGGIHMYDMIQKSGPSASGGLFGVDQAAFSKQYTYAALGTPLGAVVGVSTDFGQTWSEHPMLGTYRARTFLYGANDMCVSTSGSKAFLVTPSGTTPVNVNLFPGVANPGGVLFAAKPERYQGTAYYLGAYAPIDHNWKAVGVFATSDCRSVRHVMVPAQTPHDLLVYQGMLYVLMSDTEGSGHRVRVFATADGSSLREVLNFLSATFARSFEIVDGDFYFGLGSEAETLHPDTGRIVRVRASALAK